ncbi:MAG: hypothetical protein DWQ54_08800 [Microcystis flos-aquae TF09]|uniref:Transposase IS204/IS1001/IS1096/IS1165 DDE domain-containing protein n=1 Tax=Microcystis flos-aquae TF09 TaxID=2060473 RepID=A0A3E0L6E1_9CHRO|nr:MAG: hypothetical protein DWQ54_08800 [Microcystis flos-aquae TF09]
MSIVCDLERTNQLNLLPDKDLVDLCPHIEPYQVTKNRYFERRTTNGVVEGINNKLKLIKRRGYGFRNFRNFWVRSMLSWHLVC